MRTVRVRGPLTRLARRHGLTRSPLRRSTDRVEAAVTAAAAVLALLSVLLAIVVAMSIYQRAQAQAAVQAAQQTSASAVLLTNAAVPLADSPERGVGAEATALARWSLPTGQQRTAPLWVGADRHAGDRISIWIDQHGNRVDPPATPSAMIADAAAYGIACSPAVGCCSGRCGGLPAACWPGSTPPGGTWTGRAPAQAGAVEPHSEQPKEATRHACW